MNEYENRAKRLKVIYSQSKKTKEMSEKMEIDKKSNFSSINPTNGAIVRGGNSNAKGDIKKLVIKNFKSKLR